MSTGKADRETRNPRSPTRTVARLTRPVSERYDHIRGPIDAPVQLVEYGDYECPHCGQAYYIVKELERLLANRLCFVFRNFPLTSIHPHAEHAAEAAEAAGAQGKFWGMHDCLFEHQDALDDIHLIRYATMLGLDVPRFSRELSEHRHAARVLEDFLNGMRSGVNATPTFFINGVRHDGSYDLGVLLDAIEDAVATQMTGERLEEKHAQPR
jgi:protein-disulfide isomerase